MAPSGNCEVENVAAPLFTGTVPITVGPFRIWMLPVAALGESEISNVRVWPRVAVVVLVKRKIVVGALTVTLTGLEVEGATVVLPEYLASMGKVPPKGSVDVVVATPLTTVAVPRVFGPVEKVTVPVAVGGVMVAVSVICSKAATEVGLTARVVVEEGRAADTSSAQTFEVGRSEK